MRNKPRNEENMLYSPNSQQISNLDAKNFNTHCT